VDETIAKLRASQEALKSLGDSFTKHSQEIKKIPEIQQRHAALEKQSKHKDMKIKKQENTIETLVGKISAKETEVEEEMTKFNKEKEAFEEEQERIRKEAETATKRQKVRAAELANEQAKEVENLKAELNTKYEMDVKALKEDKAKWETQHEEELTRLEASNQERTQRITDLETQLERAREQARRDQERYEDIEAAKSKYKSEKEEFATKLQKLENEFSLDSHPDDF
jgi:DNA repair exonuclease SbcCD ATPase subunit